MNNKNTHTYSQLDSLRGIASVQVMNHHLLLMAPIMWMNVAAFQNSSNPIEQFTFYLQYSPLHLWYMADEAVVFFFVLSGFVLYNSLDKKIDLRVCVQYLTRRFFRLYVPFATAILLSMLLRSIVYTPRDTSALSKWFQYMWSHPVGIVEFFQLIIFKAHDFHNIVTSLWSIEIEIKLSILVPLFILCINIFRKYKVVDFIFTMSILVISFFIFHNPESYFSQQEGVFYDLFVLRFGFAFIAGMILCKYLPYIKKMVTGLAWPIAAVIVIVNSLLYSIIWLFWIFPQDIQGLLNTFRMEMVIFTSCIFIAVSFNKHLNKFLSNRYLVHLGKISFSLYLIHPIILLTVTYLFMAYLSLPVIWAIIFVMSIAIAHFTYTYFEMPVNNFGRKLSNKYFAERQAEKAI